MEKIQNQIINLCQISENIFNKDYWKLLRNKRGGTIGDIIETTLLDAFNEVYDNQFIHGSDSSGHDIEHISNPKLIFEVKSTGRKKGKSVYGFSQNKCNAGEDSSKWKDPNFRIPHIMIKWDITEEKNKYKIKYSEIFLGKCAYNDWNFYGRSGKLNGSQIKELFIKIK